MPTTQDEFQPGERLGEFRIDRRIGRGGMGSVYLAEDTRLRRWVALKVILPALSEQPDFRRRFEQEARAAASIDHPNVVSVYSAGLLDGRLYLAMRYVEGESLDKALEARGALDAEDATRIVSSVAGALDAAHATGLVHRDVTPANVILEGNLGRTGIYLTDFGLARSINSDETRLTRTQEVIANLDYAAPEQIRGDRVDARTDVYSLGCVLYRMLSGERPFPGTDAQKMWKVVHEPVPPLAPDGDPLNPVIARATAKDPSHRYPSAGDLARAAATPQDAPTRPMSERSVAIGPAASGMREGAAGGDESSTAPLEQAHSTGDQGTEVLPTNRRDGSRRRTLMIAAAALALLASFGVTASLITSGGGEGSREERGNAPTYFKGGPRERIVVRPKTIGPPPLNGSPPFASDLVTWKNWGAPRTESTGRVTYSTCKPSCAEGARDTRGIVVLSRIRKCGDQVQYTRVRFILPGHAQYDATFTYRCDGWLTSTGPLQ